MDGDLAVPVDRPAHPLHLRADLLDVLLDDLAGVAAVPDGGVLGVQAERVETHRPHDAPAVAAMEMREDVTLRVVPDLSHVQRAGRVGEHLEQVEVAPVGVAGIGRVEGARLLPGALPLGLDRLWVVRLHLAL